MKDTNKQDSLNDLLKPCPFCGGKAELTLEREISASIYCKGCGSMTKRFYNNIPPLSVKAFAILDSNEIIFQAIDAWNKRADSDSP